MMKGTIMSYSQLAQLEFMNAINSIKSESELNEFRNMLAHYFAQKALQNREESLSTLPD